jgi:hypothetical protein
MLGFIGVTAGILQMATPSAAQQPAQVPSAAIEEAQRSLRVLQRLETGRDHYKGLGFASRDEAKSAALSEPMRLFVVPLDRLKEYQPGGDPNRLLVDSNRLIFPVNVGGEHRSSLTLLLQDGKWQVVSFGRPALTKALSDLRLKQATATRAAANTFFAVHVPALRHYFIARREGAALLLAPLLADAALGWEAGQEIDAQRAFAALAPQAKELPTGPEIVN